MERFQYEKDNQEQLNQYLAECTVLLKKDGMFPLGGPCTIAAYGSGVRKTVKGGTGSGEVNSRAVTGIEEALMKNGFRLISGQWLDAYDKICAAEKKKFAAQLMEQAQKTDVNPLIALMGAVMPEPEYDLPLSDEAEAAVYVLARISGEGNDRNEVAGDIRLTNTEIRDILELNSKYEKFMLVINAGGSVDLSPVSEVRNILVLSQLGAETGTALIDILLGRQNPSGKLAVTWDSAEGACPQMEFGDPDETYYLEGIYVGYRYYDTVGKRAMFPFGYGLSFTEFQTEKDGVCVEGQNIQVHMIVKNTGAYAGKEVVQVYVTIPEGELCQPYQVLAGFAKTSLLQPGESERVTVAFRLDELASYHTARSCYMLEKGEYILRAGNSSVDTEIAGVVCLDQDVITRQTEALVLDAGFDPVHFGRAVPEVPEGTVYEQVSAKDIPTEEITYAREEKIDERVKDYTDQELILMSMGAFDVGNESCVIGNAGTRVAGAAGQTVQLSGEKELPVLVMADGPAGLRLSPEFFRDEEGTHVLGNGSIPESVTEVLPPEMIEAMMAVKSPGEGVEIEYQYATAIPIGTAIAQSWNLEFARLCGDIVGDEMERFGVQLWLAPALNIQRHIRCGRNFEYYSEDPLVSGRFAAAITKGVQGHPGCGVVIKHFAANNQETNRMNNNSHVDERTLREIYLKGFGICVREASPYAVMTSYNLLNGVHTSEMRSLTEGYLRSEQGFDGIVMTDWLLDMAMSKTQKWRNPIASKIAQAGGNLIMPGEQKDYDELKESLENGKLDRKQLEMNVSGTLRVMERLG